MSMRVLTLLTTTGAAAALVLTGSGGPGAAAVTGRPAPPGNGAAHAAQAAPPPAAEDDPLPANATAAPVVAPADDGDSAEPAGQAGPPDQAEEAPGGAEADPPDEPAAYPAKPVKPVKPLKPVPQDSPAKPVKPRKPWKPAPAPDAYPQEDSDPQRGEALDGTDLGACYTGNCEVEVHDGDVIRLDESYRIPPIRVGVHGTRVTFTSRGAHTLMVTTMDAESPGATAMFRNLRMRVRPAKEEGAVILTMAYRP
ncbi:hypothetical protein [Actinomadura fibrosa]|uniref:Uncharacterized protein n=1 Tax=Actinomadura fibrosa TaxID=111802 RepID=A0ABW2XG81_9ACTN